MKNIILMSLLMVAVLPLVGCAGFRCTVWGEQSGWVGPQYAQERMVVKTITHHAPNGSVIGVEKVFIPYSQYLKGCRTIPKSISVRMEKRYSGFYGLPLAESYVILTNGLHGKNHNAVDIRANVGTQVLAAASGQITKARWDDRSGNMIEIYHPERHSYTIYCHLSQIHVTVNQYVMKGQVIGLSGCTGWDCRGSHLHFAVRNDRNPFGSDPLYTRIYSAS